MRNDGYWSWFRGKKASLSIVRTGRNAWRRATADRVSFLVDGQAYFQALEGALERAEREIWIVGWDFNPDIRLRPEDAGGPTLGAFLSALVQRRPELTIRILIWAMGPVYSGKSLKMFRRKGWAAHERIKLHLDWRHPIRGSHHQKFVVIDDCLAFVGGIDLTAKRWDTPEHRVGDPRRAKPDGTLYEPVHDMQVALEGEAARVAGDLARRRWRMACDETIAPCPPVEATALDGVVPDLVGAKVAFARTEPAIRGRKGTGEASRLTLDALARAKRHIYIESQYFASEAVCRVLCERLQEPDGPEVIILSTLSSHGTIERLVLGANRDRFVRRLSKCDRYGRLRAAYPVVPKPDGGEQEIIIHSKIVIVDDCFLRVGSSNLNQRSERLDSELDIAIEADRPSDRLALAALRDRLIAEHLDTEPDVVSGLIAAKGSMVGAFDTLNVKPRGLRRFMEATGDGETTPVMGTGLVDPVAPWWPLSLVAVPVFSFFRRQFGLFARSGASSGPSSVSLSTRDNNPSGSGMKK